jgi:hypothetical protein
MQFKFGGPEVFNWTPIEVGEPGAGQVRMCQAATGLNYIDVYHRTGSLLAAASLCSRLYPVRPVICPVPWNRTSKKGSDAENQGERCGVLQSGVGSEIIDTL